MKQSLDPDKNSNRMIINSNYRNNIKIIFYENTKNMVNIEGEISYLKFIQHNYLENIPPKKKIANKNYNTIYACKYQNIKK